MSQLPKGWKETDLKSLISISSGKSLTQKKMVEGDVPVFGGNGITGWHNEGNTTKATIVIGRVGFYCGSVYITPENAWITDNAFITSFSEDHSNIDFLYWLLKFTDLRQNDSSSAQPVISGQKVYPIKVKLPPLAEQTRIVEKLDEVLAQVDTIKARLDSIPAIIKRFRQSVLAAAVSGKLTEEWRGGASLKWEEKIFSDICREITVGFVGKMKDQYIESGILFLRSQNVRAFRYDPKNVLYISDEFHSEIYKSRLEAGDLAIVRSGAPGTTCVVPKNLGKVNCSDLVIARPNEQLISKFGCIFMNSEVAQKNVQSNQVGIAQQHFNVGSMKKMPILLPPIEEQKEIVRLVDQYFAFADTIEAQVKKAQTRVNNLTQSILAKAFRGELVAQDPSDEPADKLLERIAQARIEAEALAKAAKKIEAAKKKAAKKASA